MTSKPALTPDLEIYFSTVPQENRFKLDKSLDYDHDGVQRDLGTIATAIDQWEGRIAEELQLTRPEIEAIRTKYPGDLPLQTKAALQKWQEKFSPMATYRALITAFVRAGRGDCAEAVCKVLQAVQGSQPGSQSVPQAIQCYAMYLKGVYESAIVSSDKFPNLTCGKFINLALVKSGRVSRSEADEFTRATLHGHVDEILQKKEPIKLEEVMKPVEGQDKMKCVYIHGAPGIGKSTCMGELCRRWDEIDALKEYSLVIFLRLREKRVQEAKSVKDLCSLYDHDSSIQVAAEMKACEGKGVLFVLDGFDELPASLRKQDSIFTKLICGTYLSHCTVLVTSRPSATADLLKVARPQIHKQIEVIGFTQEHIEQYARAFFASQPEVLANFLTYISTHPAIKSLMYIPLNCAIIVEIYNYKRTANRPIPQTMTQLYTEMSLTLLQRHIGEDDLLAKKLPERLEDLPPPLLEPFCSLAELAFDGLESNDVIFHNLSNSFVHFGFMNSPTELYMGRKASVSHSFLHLTLQEFLAAFHISQASPSDQQSVFEKHCGTKVGWDMVWRFVAGLSGFHGIGWDVVKSKKGKTSDGVTLPFFIECLYEAQEKADCDLVLEGGSEVIHFGGTNLLDAVDCYAVGYCVANSKHMWRLEMDRNEKCEVVEMLIHGLQSPNKSPPLKEHPKILSLSLADCDLTSVAFNQLADVIPLMTNLEELDIQGNSVGNGGLVKLLQALSHLKYIEILIIRNTNIGSLDIDILSYLMSVSSSMKKVGVGSRDDSCEIIKSTLKTVLQPSSLEHVSLCLPFAIVTLLEENSNLTTLTFEPNCLTPYSTAFNQIADFIPFLANLEEFNISFNPANDGGIVKLLHTLSHLKCLQVLNLVGVISGCEDLKALSHLISPSSSVKKLSIGPAVSEDLCNFMFENIESPEINDAMLKIIFSPSSLEHLILTGMTVVTESNQAFELLRENNNLNHLEISNVSPKISNLVTAVLCKNFRLKVFRISLDILFNYYSLKDIVPSVVELLCSNQVLKTLILHNSISQDELLTLSDALKFNHTLETLNVGDSREVTHMHPDLDKQMLDTRIARILS